MKQLFATRKKQPTAKLEQFTQTFSDHYSVGATRVQCSQAIYSVYSVQPKITNVLQRAQSIHIDIHIPEAHIGSGTTPKKLNNPSKGEKNLQ